ncbi:FAD-dependent oxidoreductase [Acidiferrobacter sp.]|uniref:FAD-dependent oxidoreductase n=1 Tax=Acidiferrobacter sp. TaxID=1872107 RepID=UPI002630E818|nr:FAD-dependent oxidoreductase [Acidiferrobacter sp.]
MSADERTQDTPTADAPALRLARGWRYEDLFLREGLARLDGEFLNHVEGRDPALGARLRTFRAGIEPESAVARSALLLAVAAHLETFIAELFRIENEAAALHRATASHDGVMQFKKQFVLRRARRYRGDFPQGFADLDAWLDDEAQKRGLPLADREWAIARLGEEWLADESRFEGEITRLTQWCAMVLNDGDIRARFAHWSSFILPERVDHTHLVPINRVERYGVQMAEGPQGGFRRRDGFHLTDLRMDARHVQSEIHYCLYCHDHDGDFCSKGFPEKKGVPELGLKVDPLGVTLTGCPLDEKISEMNLLRRDGQNIAALAMVMIDNPMVPATGHRICNDCMKGCIYQKQDAVNIPQIETRVLTDVLDLPWGVEIYDLLTRWNPLLPHDYLPGVDNGHKVLVVGMGPAGFTMAHYLSRAGCAVLGIDGLKIEPLPPALVAGPVFSWRAITEDLDERILHGFGGVAEYGITVRWDKNFLKLIYLSLARRARMRVIGGVRFGGTIRVDDAWALGFDHICIATGAGLPRVVPMTNSLARGMRQASDFLMALQLTGAGKDTSLANLQVRLPAVVIGGGLTAVDTATEVQTYYIKQVSKILARYETMVETLGVEAVRKGLPPEDEAILDEFLAHGRAVRAERERAGQAGEEANFIPLLRSWGGVTLAYRKGMNNSPAYTRNHEELIKALQEGLYYAEGLDPLRADLDNYGHVQALVLRRMREVEGRWVAGDQEVRLPARTVLVAAGTVPNTIYEREYPGTFVLDGDHFEGHVAHDDHLQAVQVAAHCKAPETGPFTSYAKDAYRVSFLGDTHAAFHGSVVKAVASSKSAFPQVMGVLSAMKRPASAESAAAFLARMRELFEPRVAAIDKSNPAVAEIWIKAPMAARNFRPGQFFRLQTFESLSPVVANTRLQVPVITVSGTGVEDDRVRLMVLQWGAGARVAGALRAGDPLILMGPTGAPTDIPSGQTILVVAGRWGAAVMLDIGPALRAAGNRVVYIAAFAKASELDNQEGLEEAADQIVWCTAQGPRITARRAQDRSVEATDMVALLRQYADGALDLPADAVGLSSVDRILVMGSTGLLKAFQGALKGSLQPLFKPDVKAIATVGSPMQCMMKGVCAQCLQWQIDPATGLRTRAVFSCAEQDQPLAWVDLDNLAARQGQNRLSERLSNQWLSIVLDRAAARKEGRDR